MNERVSHRPDHRSAGVIFLNLALTVALVAAIKLAHDFLKERNARLIDRYMDPLVLTV